MSGESQEKRPNYFERLAGGRPIGSGMIEGVCKNYRDAASNKPAPAGPSATSTAWPPWDRSSTPTSGPITETRYRNTHQMRLDPSQRGSFSCARRIGRIIG